MSDKILKEAYDKIVNVEEGYGQGNEEGIDALEEVQHKLFMLIDQLEDAIGQHVPDSLGYWQAYGLAHLKVIAGSDEYAASDGSISKLIDKLRKEEDDDEDERTQTRHAGNPNDSDESW